VERAEAFIRKEFTLEPRKHDGALGGEATIDEDRLREFERWEPARVQMLFSKVGGVERAEAFIRGDLKLVSHHRGGHPIVMLKSVDTPTIRGFVAAEAFSPANGFDISPHCAEVFTGCTDGYEPAWSVMMYKIQRDERDRGLAAEVGAVSIGRVFHVLMAQSSGQEGPLRSDAPNLAFIKDDGGRLWTIEALHRGAEGGWKIDAIETSRDTERKAGTLCIGFMGYPERSCWDTLDHD
jgi:hypothetical protein